MKAVLSAALRPHFATLVDVAPHDADWLYENNFNGYSPYESTDMPRKGQLRIFTRSGLDQREKFDRQYEALAGLASPKP
jgi:hypothetical protein